MAAADVNGLHPLFILEREYDATANDITKLVADTEVKCQHLLLQSERHYKFGAFAVGIGASGAAICAVKTFGASVIPPALLACATYGACRLARRITSQKVMATAFKTMKSFFFPDQDLNRGIPSVSDISLLPKVLHPLILIRLGRKDRLNMREVCTRWKEIVDSCVSPNLPELFDKMAYLDRSINRLEEYNRKNQELVSQTEDLFLEALCIGTFVPTVSLAYPGAIRSNI